MDDPISNYHTKLRKVTVVCKQWIKEPGYGCIDAKVRTNQVRWQFLALYLVRRTNFWVSCLQKKLFAYTKDTSIGSLDTEPVSWFWFADPHFVYRCIPWEDQRRTPFSAITFQLLTDKRNTIESCSPGWLSSVAGPYSAISIPRTNRDASLPGPAGRIDTMVRNRARTRSFMTFALPF